MSGPPNYGPRPLKSRGRHGHFLNSTCDIGLSDMRQGLNIIVTWATAFSYIRNVTLGKISDKDMRIAISTCDIGPPNSVSMEYMIHKAV